MKYLYTLSLFYCLTAGTFAQVIISPEIGVSRAPLLLYGANSFDESKSFDLIYGLNIAQKINCDLASLLLRGFLGFSDS